MYLTQMEENVEKLYRKLEIQNPKDLDMRDICGKLNIKFNYWYFGSESGSVYNKSYIFIDQTLDYRRQWFDFAHELGHILQHCGNQRKLPYSFIKYQENQANSFAKHFLVPTFLLLKIKFPPIASDENVQHIMNLFPVDQPIANDRLLQYSATVFENHLNKNLSF